jgi:transcription antitermination protein NusB
MPRRRARGEDRRSEARERALTLLYEAETKGVAPRDVLAAQVMPPDADTSLLVLGVADHLAEIDPVIAANATGWTLERMPAIDRLVLRIAAFELLGRPDVPVPVVLDEAVELAKRFSTDDSGRFVNGVLASVATVLRPPEPEDSL